MTARVAGTRAEGVSETTPGAFPDARLPLPGGRPVRARRAVVLAAGRRQRRRLRRPPRADPHGRQAQARLQGDARGCATARVHGRRAAAGASDRVRAQRSPSRAPTEGAVLTDGENLPVRVLARDNRGGVGMRRVELLRRRPPRPDLGRRPRERLVVRLPLDRLRRPRRRAARARPRARTRRSARSRSARCTPGSFGDGAAPLVRWRSGAAARGRARPDRRPRRRPRRRRPAQGDAVRRRPPPAHDAPRRRAVAHARLAARRPGKHRLTLRAEDRAGNVRAASASSRAASHVPALEPAPRRRPASRARPGRRRPSTVSLLSSSRPASVLVLEIRGVRLLAPSSG